MTRSISLLTQHTDPFVTVCFLSTYTVLTSYRYVYGINRVNSGPYFFYFDIVRMFTRLSIALTSGEILEFNFTSRTVPQILGVSLVNTS